MTPMKRIKQIVEALRVFHDSPIQELRETWNRVSNGLMMAAEDGRLGDDDIDPNDWKIITSVVRTFVSIAEDMEKPAKPAAGGEA